jgi:ribonuclease R
MAERPTVPGLTIDSEHSRDLDDALWAVAEERGIRVWVSIADLTGVADLHRGGSALTQALLRCQTEYRGTRIVRSMLPTELESAHSLLPDEPRPVLTWESLIDERGAVLEERLYPATLISHLRVSYAQTDAILQGETQLQGSWVIAAASQAAAALNSRRTGLWGKAHGGQYYDDEGRICDASHALIASLAIAYNEAVARRLKGRPGCYRVHDPATDPEIRELMETWSGSREQLIPLVAHRLPSAEYADVPRAHWALNLPSYLRVTSPLRRLEDLVNQQQLIARLQGERRLPWSAFGIRDVVERLNDRRLADAERSRRLAKQQMQRVAQTVERQAPAVDLTETVTANQLAKLLRTAVESGQCSDGLERAVRSFIREERLTTRHMAEVLLGGAVFPAQLRQQVLTAIDPSATDRHPVSVLNTLKTLSPEWAVREQFEQSGDGQWCCRLEAAGRVAAAAAGAKAQARQEAALALLRTLAE